MNAKYILQDIEGTISDIHFVRNILFPYSAKEMRNFISSRRNDGAVRECLRQTECPDDETAIQKLLEWIEKDVKHPALKTIQGLIWKKGYETGAYKAHLYPDVIPTWTKWRESGLRLGIYSSGSVFAQKLFFKYSEAGDVSHYLDHFFDLDFGGKREPESYQKIARYLSLPCSDIVFLSDIREELIAANATGMQTVHILRPGNSAAPYDASAVSIDQLNIRLA